MEEEVEYEITFSFLFPSLIPLLQLSFQKWYLNDIDMDSTLQGKRERESAGREEYLRSTNSVPSRLQ